MSQSPAELRSVLDHVPFMICRCDAQGRYRYANQAYVSRFSRSPESIIGLHISELLGAAAFAVLEPYVRRALAGERVEFELDVPYDDGRRIVRCAYQPEFADGQVTGFVAAITDETARLRAEEALRASREHLDFIVDSTDIGVWSCDLPFDVLMWNAKCKEHFGLPPDAAITIDTFYERMHPDDVEPTRAAIDLAIRHRVSYDTEYRTLRADGAYRWLRAIGRAAYAADGSPIRFDGVTVDLTTQKAVEDFLRAREAHFRSMADNAPAMLWVSEADGRCSYLSRQWYEYTDRTPEQELGVGRFENIHPDDQSRARDVFFGANARQIPFSLDYRLRHRDGVYRWVVETGLPRFESDGTFQGFVGSVIDVHERKVIEQQLEESDRRKDEFLATLGHELRNPLAPLLTAVHLMQQARDDERIVDRSLAMMGRQVTQMVRLVDDLLDVSRITRGKLQLRPERVSLATIVNGAVESAGAAIRTSGHRLTVELPDAPVYLHADPTRLSQALLNLLNNAAKYTPPGGELAVKAAADDGVVTIHVVDNGIGFTPASAERLFEMFVQTDESRDLAQGGLGIGLTLVRQLIEMHHGQVTARSAGVGQGSQFTITLPMATDTAAPASDPPDAPPAAAVAPRRILVADDNADAATSLALLLERDGHDVRVANDGEEALRIASHFLPDVVLLDIGMPKMNGYETARRLRQLPRGNAMLVVALTGWGQPRDQRRSDDAGIDRHFAKPIEPVQLRALLAGRITRERAGIAASGRAEEAETGA